MSLVDINVNPLVSPRIIQVPSPATEISIQDLVDSVRAWEDSELGLFYPYLIDATGKEALGGEVYVGITATLRNAQLEFESRGGPSFVQCNVNGGNLVAVDAVGNIISPIKTSSFTQVVLTSSSSATLQELSAIQYGSFNGGVTIDVTGSYSGTAYPVGTVQQPVNNLSDATTIAANRGFDTLYILGNITVDSSGDYTGMLFIGESMTKSTITISSAANVTNCEFYEATVAGVLDGNAKLQHCKIGTLDYIHGIVEQCVLSSGTITLGGSSTAHFLDCWSGVVGLSIPVIDCGGSGQELSLRNYNGGIQLQNKTGSEKISIDLNSGQVILDSTVTNGQIVIRGIGKLVDNSTGSAQVDSTHLLSPSNIASAVWDESTTTHTATDSFGELAVKIQKILQVEQGNWKLDNSTKRLIIYDSDGITPLFTFNLYDSNGQPSITEVTERRAI